MDYFYPPIPPIYALSTVSTAATGVVNGAALQADIYTLGRVRVMTGAWLATASNTTLTVTLAGHGAVTGDSISIKGVTGGPYNNIPISEINTNAAITVLNANQFTFSSTTTANATGSVTPTGAITLQFSGGGGTVYIPAGNYAITGPINMVSGVMVEGVRPRAGANSALLGGTVLDGVDYTTQCFTYNATDAAGDYANNAAMNAEIIYSGGLANLGFRRFTDCVKIGALYKVGYFYGLFENLYCTDWTGWAFYFENNSLGTIRNLWARNIRGGGTEGNRGIFFYGASNASLSGPNYNHGNVRVDQVFGENGANTVAGNVSRSRGICFVARGTTGAVLNDVIVTKLQCNLSGVLQTENVTLPAGTDITVANSAIWPIGMPVTVTASGGGLLQNVAYFVTAQPTGTTIRLSDTVGGTAKTTTAVAVQLRSYGYNCLETVGTDENAGNKIQPSSFIGLDMEGPASHAVLAQKCIADWAGHTLEANQGAASINTWCFRGACAGEFRSASQFTCDIPTNSVFAALRCGGGQLTNITTGFPQGVPIGTWYIASIYRWVMNLNAQPASQTKLGSLRGASTNSGTNAGFLYPEVSMGQRVNTWSTASKAFTGAEAGSWAYTGGATSCTLPALIVGLPSATENITAGMTFEIVHAGTAATVLTVNVATPASEFINSLTAKTSVSITAGGGCTFRAQTNGSVTFWVVVGAFGTVV